MGGRFGIVALACQCQESSSARVAARRVSILSARDAAQLGERIADPPAIRRPLSASPPGRPRPFHLEFVITDETIIVETVDSQSGIVVRVTPRPEQLELARTLRALRGRLFDQVV